MTILAVHDVFKRIEEAADTEFLVRVSYVELYQEEIRDLLNPEAGTLKIADHPVLGHYVKGLTEEVVLSPERVLELMAIGEANRHVAATNMNLRSSRSHTLFKMVIESRRVETVGAAPARGTLLDGSTLPVTGGSITPSGAPTMTSLPSSASLLTPRSAAGGAGGGGLASAPSLARMMSSASGLQAAVAASTGAGAAGGAPSLTSASGTVVRVANLHLIDLAGSERVSKTGAAGTQLKESGVINASLLTLGVVINKLISGDAHIPYRDSKLTRLLSTSLGGNAKTAVVVTISPTTWNIGETRSSLQFAARAMKVRAMGERGGGGGGCSARLPSTPPRALNHCAGGEQGPRERDGG